MLVSAEATARRSTVRAATDEVVVRRFDVLCLLVLLLFAKEKGLFRSHRTLRIISGLEQRLVARLVDRTAPDNSTSGVLVTRDRADHHLTEISYIYTFLAHVIHPCTITMLCIHGQGYVVSHTNM